MNVTFDEKTVPCRRVICGAGYMRPGDFIQWQGGLCKVITVQREAFDLRLHQFVMVTVETRDHRVVPVRGPGMREILRPVR